MVMHYLTLRDATMQLNIIDPMEDLLKAAWVGDEQTLEQVLQRDATILDKIQDRETSPLHVSALLGHVGFTELLLNRNRDLAIRVDSVGRTALHLASSAEDNLQTVQKLLQFNNQPCLVRDKEKRIPLHYAAMRGRKEVVQELIKACPESLRPSDKDKTTVFHLCVTYNHLETLQAMIKLDHATANITARDPPGSPIFTLPDRTAGNTILHLAVKFKRDEFVRYLLSIPEIRQLKKKQNGEGLTARDILDRSPKDWKIDEIKLTLTMDDMEEAERTILRTIFECIGNCFMKIFEWIGNLLKPGGNANWLEVMRGNLSAASIFIATITFQALINPPADFIQQDSTLSPPPSSFQGYNNYNHINLSPSSQLDPEDLSDHFQAYVNDITLCFYASICVTLLLVSGVPLQNSAMIWMLSMGMSLTLFFLSSAYDTAAGIMVMKRIYKSKGSGFKPFGNLWRAALSLVVGFYTLRFLLWIVKKFYRIIKKLARCCCH